MPVRAGQIEDLDYQAEPPKKVRVRPTSRMIIAPTKNGDARDLGMSTKEEYLT